MTLHMRITHTIWVLVALQVMPAPAGNNGLQLMTSRRRRSSSRDVMVGEDSQPQDDAAAAKVNGGAAEPQSSSQSNQRYLRSSSRPDKAGGAGAKVISKPLHKPSGNIGHLQHDA
jgi:hypothetical protein